MAPDSGGSATKTGTILVVDDNEGPRMTLEALLAPEGYVLLFAENGPAALETARRELPDVMLLDVMMPEMDGFQVCRALRDDPATAKMPVVMVTALEDERSRIAGIDSGADDFLTKPVKRQELLTRVRTIVRLNRYRTLLDQQAALDFMASHDTVTRLPSRDRLLEELGHEIGQGEHFALLSIGIGGFRDVVESLGHGEADKAAVAVADRLTSTFKARDTVARTGANEFAVLLPGVTSPKVLAAIVRRATGSLAAGVALGPHEFYLNSSVGICLYPQDGDEPSTLLRNALAAQRRASEAGWYSHYFYSESLAGSAMERLVVQSDLRRAIAAGALHVVYQPQIDAGGGAMVGVESLVRWQHPERGMVPPSVFVPMAEDSGLIAEMGEYVLREVCRQLGAWDAAGLPPFRVAVNVSAVEVKSERFVDRVRAVLAETGVDARRLELELTESALAPAADSEDGHDVLARLNALRELGLHLAVDDFGTGYSCLRYLKTYPIDRLKIDQSFVRGLPTDDNDVAISQAVIALGRSLRMEVVAEGVETAAQAEHLRDAGCDVLQGYLFSRPVPGAELSAFLTRSRDPE